MSFHRIKFSRAKRIEIRRELGKQFIGSFISSLCHFSPRRSGPGSDSATARGEQCHVGPARNPPDVDEQWCRSESFYFKGITVLWKLPSEIVLSPEIF